MLSHFFAHYYNVIGLMGVTIILLIYLLLQLGKVQQDSVLFSLANFVGSVLILTSLNYSWNLPSGVIEVAWLLISAFGLMKSMRLRQQRKSNG